ncbi:MAG: hypothetical protein K2Q09_09645 [Phycisphaerales bacterium]|nr:hypothetical protein [Phycisphaerales bacterium]
MKTSTARAAAACTTVIVALVAWRAFTPRDGAHRLSVGPLAGSGDTEPGSMSLLLDTAPLNGPEAIVSEVQRAPTLFVGDRGEVGQAVSERQIGMGVEHVAQAVWLRYSRGDGPAYAKWRTEYGYRGPTPARVGEDPLLRNSLLRQAGLPKEATDPSDWFQAIWDAHVSKKPRAVGVSSVSGANLAAVGLLASGVKVDPAAGPLEPFPRQAAGSSELPPVIAHVLAKRSGQGWPFWQPPPDVQQRLARRGTPLLEVVTTLTSPNSADDRPNRADTLGTLAAFDAQTGKWWIVQFWIYNIREGGAVDGALF